MKRRVLWIEDGATYEAQHLAGPVYNSRRYDLTIALAVSDAIRHILKDEFDVVIVDIRMEPGDSPEWINLHEKGGSKKLYSRLGLALLYSLFRPEEADIKLAEVPRWIKPRLFGVLTVETLHELKEHFLKLGVGVSRYRQKAANLPTTSLLDLIDEVIDKASTEAKKE